MTAKSAKASNIEQYFSNIRKQIKTFSENRMVIDAMREFKPAFHNIFTDVKISKPILKDYESSVRNYYNSEFLPRLHDNLEPSKRKGIENYWSNEDIVTYFQYKYISGNPNELGSKHELMYSDDKSKYAEAHKRYHPIIKNYLEAFEYYDIFLLDDKTGHIVYSVFKEADYATSLKTGPYKNSNFARVFREAANATNKDFVKLIDFEHYQPSYDAPASFIASPIYDGDKRLGVAVFQMPVGIINNIMTSEESWEKKGFGQTGEAFLVAENGFMRSQARQLIENKDAFLKIRAELGDAKKDLNQMDKLDTTIGLIKVKNQGIELALSGKIGHTTALGLSGEEVFSSYAPIKVEDVNWVIISEFDEEEAMAPIHDLAGYIVTWGAIIIALAIGLALWFGRSILTPLAKTTHTLKDISQGEGDLTVRFADHPNANDIPDQLARHFNVFITTIHGIIKEVKDVSTKLDTASSSAGEVSGGLNTTAKKLKHQAESSSAAIEQISSSLDEVSASGDQISMLMKNVAASVTEMAATTKEMASQCTSSATQARDANEKSQSAGLVMKQLSEAAEKIGAVITTISDIADKTDLLALNATIEAASAGEAGKGFAVVAAEIKELSRQTQGATGEISSLIDGICGSAKEASSASEEISTIITSLNSTVEGIAAGVEEMAATAQEVDSNVSSAATDASTIASNIKEVSAGSTEVANSIQEVKTYADATENSASNANQAAEELNELSELLENQVSQFKV